MAQEIDDANPAVQATLSPARPPLEDPWGSGMYFEVRWEHDAKRARKALRRDFLGAVEKLLREASDIGAQFVFSRGRGPQ